jgi:formylglycine-generating enzyme required for sulfatase activity
MAQKPFITFKDCDRCPEMVVVPAGIFLMGSSEDELSRAKWGAGHSRQTKKSKSLKTCLLDKTKY